MRVRNSVTPAIPTKTVNENPMREYSLMRFCRSNADLVSGVGLRYQAVNVRAVVELSKCPHCPRSIAATNSADRSMAITFRTTR